MKKICMFFPLLLAFAIGCSPYPMQSMGPKRLVPKVTSYFTEMPLIKELGKFKWIHDMNSNSLIIFKENEDTLLNQMTKWLDEYVDEGEEQGKTPVILIAGTNIAPFTLFTKKELREYKRSKRDVLIEMTQYRSYTVTLFKKTYLEDITPAEQQQFNLTIVKGNSNQQIEKSQTINPGKYGDRSNANLPHVRRRKG